MYAKLPEAAKQSHLSVNEQHAAAVSYILTCHSDDGVVGASFCLLPRFYTITQLSCLHSKTHPLSSRDGYQYSLRPGESMFLPAFLAVSFLTLQGDLITLLVNMSCLGAVKRDSRDKHAATFDGGEVSLRQKAAVASLA